MLHIAIHIGRKIKTTCSMSLRNLLQCRRFRKDIEIFVEKNVFLIVL